MPRSAASDMVLHCLPMSKKRRHAKYSGCAISASLKISLGFR